MEETTAILFWLNSASVSVDCTILKRISKSDFKSKAFMLWIPRKVSLKKATNSLDAERTFLVLSLIFVTNTADTITVAGVPRSAINAIILS